MCRSEARTPMAILVHGLEPLGKLVRLKVHTRDDAADAEYIGVVLGTLGARVELAARYRDDPFLTLIVRGTGDTPLTVEHVKRVLRADRLIELMSKM